MRFPCSAKKKKKKRERERDPVFAAKVSNVYCKVEKKKKPQQIVLAVRSSSIYFCICLEKMCRAICKKLGIVETLGVELGQEE